MPGSPPLVFARFDKANPPLVMVTESAFAEGATAKETAMTAIAKLSFAKRRILKTLITATSMVAVPSACWLEHLTDLVCRE
jgi:hypothetical protein